MITLVAALNGIVGDIVDPVHRRLNRLVGQTTRAVVIAVNRAK